MTTTTFRMPDDMGRALKSLAATKGTTVNEVVRSAIRAYLREEEERKLYDGFSLLGSDPEASKVDFAFAAAAEVVLPNE